MTHNAPNPDPIAAQVCACIAQWIDENGEGLPSLAWLGEQVGMDPIHLQKRFTQALGISPRAWAEARRRAKFKNHLRAGQDVADAIYAAGYGSPSRVYETAHSWLGMSPASYAKGGAGAVMHVAFARHDAVGLILIAATVKGISALLLGTDEKDLWAELRREYPHADLRPDEGHLGAWIQDILAGFDAPERWRALPLDVWATGFQARVWQALRDLQSGETVSYAALGHRIGAPRAARGVGQACGANRVALLIPCHRVVGQDGALRGYRWGMARKQTILDREKKTSAL